MQNCIQMGGTMYQNDGQMASKWCSNDNQNDTFWHHFATFWCHFGCILGTKYAQIRRKTMKNGVPKTIKITYTCHQFQKNVCFWSQFDYKKRRNLMQNGMKIGDKCTSNACQMVAK